MHSSREWCAIKHPNCHKPGQVPDFIFISAGQSGVFWMVGVIQKSPFFKNRKYSCAYLLEREKKLLIVALLSNACCSVKPPPLNSRNNILKIFVYIFVLEKKMLKPCMQLSELWWSPSKTKFQICKSVNSNSVEISATYISGWEVLLEHPAPCYYQFHCRARCYCRGTDSTMLPTITMHQTTIPSIGRKWKMLNLHKPSLWFIFFQLLLFIYWCLYEFWQLCSFISLTLYISFCFFSFWNQTSKKYKKKNA